MVVSHACQSRVALEMSRGVQTVVVHAAISYSSFTLLDIHPATSHSHLLALSLSLSLFRRYSSESNLPLQTNTDVFLRAFPSRYSINRSRHLCHIIIASHCSRTANKSTCSISQAGIIESISANKPSIGE